MKHATFGTGSVLEVSETDALVLFSSTTQGGAPVAKQTHDGVNGPNAKDTETVHVVPEKTVAFTTERVAFGDLSAG